jgi:hypothetical protein
MNAAEARAQAKAAWWKKHKIMVLEIRAKRDTLEKSIRSIIKETAMRGQFETYLRFAMHGMVFISAREREKVCRPIRRKLEKEGYKLFINHNTGETLIKWV